MTIATPFESLLEEAVALKLQLEDFRSATYHIVSYQHENETYNFVASFDLEAMDFTYTLCNADFANIRTIDQVPPEVLAQYGIFVNNMQEYKKGGENAYAQNTVKSNPNVLPRRHVDEPVDDSDYAL
jgi:hypothetical protein